MQPKHVHCRESFLYTQTVIVRILGLLILPCLKFLNLLCCGISSFTFLSISSLSNLYVLCWFLFLVLVNRIEFCVIDIWLYLAPPPTYSFLFFTSLSLRSRFPLNCLSWCKSKFRHLVPTALHPIISPISSSIRPDNSQTLARRQRLWHLHVYLVIWR